MDLSIIMPFCNEYPQSIFTIRNLIEELKNRGIGFEIIAVDNYCWEVQAQVKTTRIRKNKMDSIEYEKLTEIHGYQFPDRGGNMIEGSQRANKGLLKYVKYEEKLSHWNAKNRGIMAASGEYYYFVDAHVQVSRDALWNMFVYWRGRPELNRSGTIALPLTYKILDTRRQIYKLVIEDDGCVHYKFTPFRFQDETFQVPCMSACGVLMHKSIIQDLGGGWPSLLGIYGGGENFLNFVLATFGYSVNIYPWGTLFHYGNPRQYHYTYDDYSRNRALAAYMIGGELYMDQYIKGRAGDKKTLQKIRDQVIQSCKEQKEKILSKQIIDIRDWVEQAIERRWITDERMIQIFRSKK